MACESIECSFIRAEVDFRPMQPRKIPEIPSLNMACGTSVLGERQRSMPRKSHPFSRKNCCFPVRNVRLLIVRWARLGFAAGYRRSSNIQIDETASQNRPAYPAMAAFARICPYPVLRCRYTGTLSVSSARYQVRLNSFYHQKKLSEGEGNACENPDDPRREPPSSSRAQ